MLGTSQWTDGNLVTQGLLQACAAGQWARADCLLEELPHPFMRVEVCEDTAHPTAYWGQSFWTQGYLFLAHRWSGSSQRCCLFTVECVYSPGCRITCSCFSWMDSVWIPWQKSAMNFTKQSLVARHSGLWYLCRLSHQDLTLQQCYGRSFFLS